MNVSENAGQSLSGVVQTLLVPLCIRAIESQRPDALIKDERAMVLVQQMHVDPSRTLTDVDEESQVAVILRNREFDRYARDFLAHNPEAVVVHIGCGLDSRFERVDNGQVEWYDLDLPEVIDLRRQFIGGEQPRYHLLACSVFDEAWLTTVDVGRPHPYLFLAEGVFMYFEEEQVKALVLTLQKRFPGAELVFDAFSPFFVWANNLRVTRTNIGARSHWALRHGRDPEQWSSGIHLLSEWFPFRCPEPRLARVHWIRHIPLLMKATGVFRYRLGMSADY
jgi:methyltransferase (TIGR00027 family)